MPEIKTQRWTTKKKEAMMQNPATQALILTKPRRQKLQAMEIGSDVWFLVAAPVEERSNNAKTQQPRRWFWPNPGSESFRRWKSDRTCGFSQLLQWRRRTHWRVGLICFGFDLFTGFWGLEVEMWDGIWRKKERKNKKKICVSLSDVLSGLGWIEIEFRGLNFHLN